MVQIQMQIALGAKVDTQGLTEGEIVVRLLRDETTTKNEAKLGKEFHDLFESLIKGVLEASGAVGVNSLDISGVDGEVANGG